MKVEVGTVKTNIQSDAKVKKRPSFNNGRGNGASGGSGGNNGGGDDYPFFEDRKSFEADKYRLGMFFGLLVVMMTFGGIISAYVVIATNKSLEWKPFSLPIQVLISTFILIASSVTYEISEIKLKKELQSESRNWLLATTISGGIFIASQLLTWLELYNRGYYMQSNPYAGFFYFLTAVHAAHVIGGICSVGYILLRIWNTTENAAELAKRKLISKIVGWFWHFLTALWILLLLLLTFYK